MSDSTLDEYHSALLKLFNTDFGLLLNKKHNYTYTFNSQHKIADLRQIKAVAIVTYKSSTEASTRSLLKNRSTAGWNAKMFKDYDKTLAWLRTELAELYNQYG